MTTLLLILPNLSPPTLAGILVIVVVVLLAAILTRPKLTRGSLQSVIIQL